LKAKNDCYAFLLDAVLAVKAQIYPNYIVVFIKFRYKQLNLFK